MPPPLILSNFVQRSYKQKNSFLSRVSMQCIQSTIFLCKCLSVCLSVCLSNAGTVS